VSDAGTPEDQRKLSSFTDAILDSNWKEPLGTIKLISVQPTAGVHEHAYLIMADRDTWLMCDGSPFDARTFPGLYRVLGKTLLPDLTQARYSIGSVGTT
jgi:hypothetical protein